MYAKCGDINHFKRQFELVRNRDNISWNAIFVGLVHNEEQEEALNMFQRMRRGNVMADEVSFASVISACSSIRASEEGKQMHCLSIKYNLSSGLYVGSSLIDLYAKFEDMDAANLVYILMSITGVVARNALIAGHIQKNDTEKAFNVFRQMQHEGLEPSCITFASILSACTRHSMGRQLHCHILKSGIPYHDEFVGVALLGMYMKSKLHEDANNLFSEMPESKSLVLWTSLISGHTQNGYSEDALLWFQKMRSSDIRPDQATFVSILKSCADLAALRDGTVIHSLVIETGFSSDEYSSSALVDMYSKCGDVRASLQVFHEMNNKADAISWNSMIVGFAKNGYAEEALLLSYQMQFSEATPDAITLLGVLTAYSHAGLVSEGRGFFDSMRKKYGITPRVDHCACIVDLLGRGGYLKEAIEFIDKLPFEPDGVIWAPFLAACKIHGDWERGKHAAEKLIQLEPHNSSPYVLLSNIYAALGNWSEAKMVREAMRERGVRKSPGCLKPGDHIYSSRTAYVYAHHGSVPISLLQSHTMVKAAVPKREEELLPYSIFDSPMQTESFLSKVKRSPFQSVLTALRPVMKAMVSEKILNQSDVDIKIAIVSCFTQITRITTPDLPYENDLMKVVFHMIIDTFDNLNEISSPSYPKRIKILEIVAKTCSCVMLLDLDCEALVLKLFQHFLMTIR